MQGSLQPLVGMFSGDDTCLVIPVYQRNYDWKRAHCARLFDDLVSTARTGKATHFFGSIVYKVEGAVGESTIIDGQQRLTTVNLLFAALHHSLTHAGIGDDERLARRIEDLYLQSEYAANGMKLKLKPVKADATAYARLFGPEEGWDEGSNVTANFRYFLGRIAEAEISPLDLFEAVRKLQVMRLQLDPADDAQLIFESLNSTGLDLSAADMIRNWILMGHTPAEQEALYERYWNPMETDVNFQTSEFLRQFLTLRLGRTPRIDDLYEEFKTWVGQGSATMTEVLTELRCFARHYRALTSASTSSERTNRLLRRHALVDRSVTTPFLLAMLDAAERGDLADEDLVTIIRAVDTYLTRRWAVGLPTNSLNKTFALLARESAKLVDAGASWTDAVIYQLTNKSGSAAFPTDDEFREALQTRDFYRIAPQQRNYFWESLENGDSGDVRDIAARLMQGEISIEHVMPQTITPAWREELGPEADDIHATWLHRLGNLTVSGYNSSYSNASFASKRDRENGFADSPYWINKDIRERQRWDVAALADRTATLSAKALQIWPMPQSGYIPPRPIDDVLPMGEDTEFTNRGVLAWEFGGTGQRVASWRELLTQVVTMLATDHLTELERFAPSCADLRLRSAQDEDHGNWRPIAGRLEVYTGQGTYWKVVLLRRIFDHLGLDPDELVFTLKPAATTDN